MGRLRQASASHCTAGWRSPWPACMAPRELVLRRLPQACHGCLQAGAVVTAGHRLPSHSRSSWVPRVCRPELKCKTHPYSSHGDRLAHMPKSALDCASARTYGSIFVPNFGVHRNCCTMRCLKNSNSIPWLNVAAEKAMRVATSQLTVVTAVP